MTDDDLIPLYKRITTGQLRRMPIELHIRQIIERIQQQKEGVVSVVCLDIGGFSSIEAEHGYETADSLLEAIVAHVSEQEADRMGLFERYVRDSFIAVYDGLTLEEAFLETELFRKRLSETTFTIKTDSGTVDIQTTFSAGVATYPGDPEDHHELISLAEEAERRANEGGGNRTILARAANLTPKTSHYSPAQLDRLRELRNQLGRSEASLLREALDDLLRKYDQRDIRRKMIGGSE